MTLEEIKKLIADEAAAREKAAAEVNAKATADAVKNAVDAAVKPLTEKIAALEAKKPAAAPKGKGNGKKEDEGEDGGEGGDGEDAEPPAWAKGLIDKVEAIEKGVTPVIKDREGAAKQATAKKIIEGIAATKKLPSLVRDEDLLEKLIDRGITDEAAATAIVDTHLTRLKARGVDLKPYECASPAGEGAKGNANTEATPATDPGLMREQVKKLAKLAT